MQMDWQTLFRMIREFMENLIRQSPQLEESVVRNQIFRIFQSVWNFGRAIRKVFLPEEGYIFLDADYSQIETSSSGTFVTG